MYTFYFKVKLRSFLIKYGSLNALLYPDALTPLSARTLRVRETKFEVATGVWCLWWVKLP